MPEAAASPSSPPIQHAHTGAVRKLKDGYGFIAGDDGHDYFFHWSAMAVGAKDFRELTVRERVTFEIASVGTKIRAVSVHNT